MSARPFLDEYIDRDILVPLGDADLIALLGESADGCSLVTTIFIRFGRKAIICDPYTGYDAYDWGPVNIIQVTARPHVVTLTHGAYRHRLYRTNSLERLIEAVRAYNEALATFLHERVLADLRAVPRTPREHYDLPREGYAHFPPTYNRWSEVLTRDYGKILVFPFRSPITPRAVYLEVGCVLYLADDDEWPRHLAYGELLSYVTPCEVP